MKKEREEEKEKKREKKRMASAIGRGRGEDGGKGEEEVVQQTVFNIVQKKAQAAIHQAIPHPVMTAHVLSVDWQLKEIGLHARNGFIRSVSLLHLLRMTGFVLIVRIKWFVVSWLNISMV